MKSVRVKKTVVERKEERQIENLKNDDSVHDYSTVRSFSTEQRVNIKSLKVQKKLQADRKAESAIVSLALEDSVIRRHIEAAEKKHQ